MRHRSSYLLLALLLVGCGNDPAEPDAGNPADQCLGTSDRAILDPHLVDSGTGISAELEDVLFTCGQVVCTDELLGNDFQVATSCMHDCYSTTILAGLTPGCEFCWTQSVLCAAHSCAFVCLGTDEAMCVQCVLDNCDAQTNYCSGI